MTLLNTKQISLKFYEKEQESKMMHSGDHMTISSCEGRIYIDKEIATPSSDSLKVCNTGFYPQ